MNNFNFQNPLMKYNQESISPASPLLISIGAPLPEQTLFDFLLVQLVFI